MNQAKGNAPSAPNLRAMDNLAVVFGGGIGDMVVFLDALDHISRWRSDRGMQTTLITKKANLALLHAARPDIVVEEVSLDLSKLLSDAAYRSEKWSTIRGRKFDAVVSPLRSKYADLVGLVSAANRRVTLDEEDRAGFFNVWHRLNRLAYTERVGTGMSAFCQYRDLAVYLGVPFYETQIARFRPVQSDLELPVRAYCVLAPTASEPAKCWEREKVDKAVEFILGQTDLDICLCGGSEGEEIGGHIEASFGDSGRILNYMNRTNFPGWIKLVRNAQFCFGNDSASVHLASHQGVPSLCVSSLFCYGYCQPYDIEHLAIDDAVPISVNIEMPCARCHYKDFRRCAGNRECKRQVDAGGVYKCVEKVDAGRVLRGLERLISNLGLATKER